MYAAPPLRACLLPEFLAARLCLAARGGLCGGEGVPELTSGTPIDPAGPRSGVVESLNRRGASVHSVAAGADVGVELVVIPVEITTTTIKGTGGISRHCLRLPRLLREGCRGWEKI